jgi:hypothetical protein
MTLELDAAALPTLATNCVLVGHAQKADVVWTKTDFVALCEIMRNGNDPHFFMIPYQKEDGSAHFAKAKKARAERYASWAWDTVTGKAKRRASIGFYPRNGDGKTCWAAMDFDAHDDDGKRARKLVFAAFALLVRHPQLFVVLATSGSGGWHLFVFTREFHPVEDWNRLLKQAAAIIGANIQKGECEIFPSQSRGRVGYGIRAPGTWNPKHDSFGLIAFENISPLLRVHKGEIKRVSLSFRSKDGVKGSDLTYRNEKPVYRGEFDEWQVRFAITAPRTRREKLKAMVDHIFRQVGREIARRNVELQYNEKTVPTAATLSDHLQEFDELWDWWETQWLDELAEPERKKFDALRSDSNDRAAFRTIRNFARLVNDPEDDFKIVAEHLAKRLGVTLQTACNIRLRFCDSGILEPTAAYVPQKFSARFRWIAHLED